MRILRRQASEAILLDELDCMCVNIEMLPIEDGRLDWIADVPNVWCDEVRNGPGVVIWLFLLLLGHDWFCCAIFYWFFEYPS